MRLVILVALYTKEIVVAAVIILAEQFEIQEQDLVNTKNSEPTKHLIIKEHLRVVQKEKSC